MGPSPPNGAGRRSARAAVLTRRTYNRPLNDEGTLFETWKQTLDRVMQHQRWLWERQLGDKLLPAQEQELTDLRQVIDWRQVSPAGRTLWLGGTELVKRREASQFNCSFEEVRTVHDVVDAFWLLLQGCLPPDTPILTEQGPRPIADIKVGDNVWSYNQTTGDTELKPVTVTHDVEVPRDENIRINCRYGHFTTSIKHPVLVRRDGRWEYVPAGSVKTGDIVRKAAFTGNVRRHAAAWFAGAFLGDGSSSRVGKGSRRIRIMDDSLEVVTAFADTVSELSGEATQVKPYVRAGYSVPMWSMEKTLAPDNRLTTDWDRLVGELPSSKTLDVAVPAWIKATTDPAVFFSFLGGLLDTDGCVLDNKANIATSAKGLVDDLLALCPVFGVYPWLTTIEVDQYGGSGYQPTAPMYRLHFTIQDIAGCFNTMVTTSKRERMEAYLRSDKVRRKALVIPADRIDAEVAHLGIGTEKTHYNFRYQIEEQESCFSGYYTSRDKSYDHLLHYDQVMNCVRDLDIPTAFKDLTVADNHSYLCGHGSYYVLHNCGVGFKPINGSLSGFTRRMEVEVVRSTRKAKDGKADNDEKYDPATKTWTIQVGDSAEAWAKAIGKIMAGKYPARKLVLDFSQIRPAGSRLKGYGWICTGDGMLSQAFQAICEIMNKMAGKLLSKQNIWHIVNWLGTVLSNRRSAQIGLIEYGDKEWSAIAEMKPPGFDKDDRWFLGQSNNSLLFYTKPTRKQLNDLFDMIIEHGGSEPGFVNMVEMLRRAPWAKGLNPCAEVLLGDKSFCNLVELDVAKFKDDAIGMHKAQRLITRANYRQTCVNFRDGILQDSWHQNNEYLRLCGAGLTGITRRPDLTPYDYNQLKYTAIAGAYSMADEFETERPKNVTVIKPSGSLSKAIFDTTEGAHKPKARYIMNNVSFNRGEPVVKQMLDAGYWILDHPHDPGCCLVALPVGYPDVPLETVNGQDIDMESAVTQLERYKMLQRHYCTQNTSITVSFDPSEKKQIVDWFDKNWDEYVACSFAFRNKIEPVGFTDMDSYKGYMYAAAGKMGYAYLPQCAISRENYDTYVVGLGDIDIDNDVSGTIEEIDESDCPGGACPTR